MKNIHDNTLLVAHFYAPESVKEIADFVGDSLALIQEARKQNPKRLVFAGTLFMSETAKIMLPETEVIQPNIDSTCSLVTQTNFVKLDRWRNKYPNATHVMYINSSAKMKTLADIIVTSANVTDIIENEYKKGNNVIFSPDRNMGAYLNYENGYDMPVYTSVCEVHDAFKEEEVSKIMQRWTDGPKFLLAHPESPLPVLKKADFVGSTNKMLQWVKEYPKNQQTRAQIYVATEEGLLHTMRKSRSDVDIHSAPVYTGCGMGGKGCSVCPFMKLNTVELINRSMLGLAGTEIDYLSDKLIDSAYVPIKRMLDFSQETQI